MLTRMANRAEWEKRIAEWRASGLTAAQYCEPRGITPTNLYLWSSKLRRTSDSPPRIAMARVETRPPSMNALTIEVGRARIVVPQGTDEATLSCVLRALSESAR